MSHVGPRNDAQAAAAPAGDPVGAAVCTACGLACTDVAPGSVPIVGPTCEPGRQALDRRAAGPAGPEAAIDGTAATRARGLAEAAARLRAARRVLVTGLAEVTVEEATAACDLAETLGAALAGSPQRDSAIARSGGITAAWEELRDRADLVLCWFHDPRIHWPRFIDRFIAPPGAGDAPARVTLSVGPCPPEPAPSPRHVHLSLPTGREVALGRLLEARLLGRPTGVAEHDVATAADSILAAVASARCVAIVTGPEAARGTARVAVTGLLRALVAERPAFEIPTSGDGPNAAGAAAVLAWRYGTAAGVARAGAEPCPLDDRPFDALEAFTAGAFDAIVVLGAMPEALADVHTDRAGTVGVVHIGAVAPRVGGHAVHLRVLDLGDTPGTLLRPDGRTIELRGMEGPGDEPTAGDLLRGLRAAIAAMPSRRAAEVRR